MNRYFDDGQHLHGTKEACERHIFSQPGLREALSRISNERLQRSARSSARASLEESDLRI